MKTISEIKYSDDAIEVYTERPKEEFKNPFWFNCQLQEWEEDKIIPFLRLDLEEFALDNYNVIRESEKKNLEDFSDYEIELECRSRFITVTNENLQNENIQNQEFVDRLIKIINQGNSTEIDFALEFLEKKIPSKMKTLLFQIALLFSNKTIIKKHF